MVFFLCLVFFFFQAEDGIRDFCLSRGLGDVYKRQVKDGIDASIVGKRVVEAINDGELYIFTHPNYREVNKARFTGIDEAFSKSEKSPFLKDIVNQKIDMF